MDNEPVDPSRESLVAGLYGPGATVGWLLTAASVFSTWTLNPHHRRRDTITIDFVAVLLFPSVASIHLMHMIATFPGQRTELFTSSDPAVVRLAAAIEAPLTICANFVTVTVWFFAAARLAGHPKRAGCIVLVGLLALLSEFVLYFLSFGIENNARNMSRPFLFNFPWAMTAVILFLVVGLMVYLITLELVPGVPPPPIRMSEYLKNLYQQVRQLCQRRIIRPGLYSLISIPATILLSASIGAGLFERTQYQEATTPARRLLFFIPPSSSSFSDLDQAMSVGVGVLTLSFSLYAAFKKEAKRAEEQDEVISSLRQRLARIRKYEMRQEELYNLPGASPCDLSLTEEAATLRKLVILETDGGEAGYH